MTHLVFIWSATGYRLREQEGEAPEVGATVEDNGTSFVVTKVAASPLPGDSRRCAFLQPTR